MNKNKIVVPEAKDAMNKFKMEAVSDVVQPIHIKEIYTYADPTTKLAYRKKAVRRFY